MPKLMFDGFFFDNMQIVVKQQQQQPTNTHLYTYHLQQSKIDIKKKSKSDLPENQIHPKTKN